MALRILLIIVIALAALLCCKVHVLADYGEDFELRLRYLFVTWRIRRPEKGKAKTGKKRKPALQALLDHFGRFFDFFRKTASDFVRKITVERLELEIVIHDDDAAQTAILYGEACAVIYPVVGFLSDFKAVRQRRIEVRPDFTGGESSARFGCTLGIRLGALLGIAIVRLTGLLISLIKNKPAKRREGSVEK
ncbi:MAG: DUF2953 domain-containing protein [Clostridia bacterium]|nr:DUF2953 domain-containing protein [Clostridia bacterium]MDR3643688.1 DUF2953 domain-containing protein [Clostridia bacterium]